MKLTGSIWQIGRQTSRFPASRETPSHAFESGAARPGPVLTSGPGDLLPGQPVNTGHDVREWILRFSSCTSYFIRREPKHSWGHARRDL